MTLLAGATLADGSCVDLRLRGGRIDAIGPSGTLGAGGEERLELAGYVLLPAPAEPHAHLDKTLTAERFTTQPGDLLAAIAAWDAHRRTLGEADIAERAKAALRDALARGATAVRTHVDVGEGIHLRSAQALVAVREELRDVIDVQVVALCFPLTGALGAANVSLLREALEIGVNVVGGAPHVDPDPHRHLELCLELASEYGRPIDLHMDEHLDPTRLDLVDLASMAAGFPEQVTASHAVSLGMQPPERQREIAEALFAAGVAVITLPLTNLYLQGRDRPTATPRGLTAVRALLDAGVTVAAGGDNVQDPFNPIGCGDPLETAQLLVAAAQLDCSTAYELVSGAARTVLGLPPLSMAPGSPADFLAVAGSSLREAIATRSEQRIVIRAGRVLARTRVEHDYASLTPASFEAPPQPDQEQT
jgi:cytosine deaminase